MSFSIQGIGCSNPRFSLEQSAAAEAVSELCCRSEEQKRLLKILHRRTGIRKRFSVLLERSEGAFTNEFYHLPCSEEDRGPGTAERMKLYETHAGQLSIQASREALAGSGCEAHEITHLITVSCTGFFAPGSDLALIQGLDLSDQVHRVHLGFMGCQAVLNALGVADSISRADSSARILIASVELCSLHFQYGWDPEQVVSNALFADGAGSLVGGAFAEGQRRGPSVLACGSKLIAGSASDMTWNIRDHGFSMTLSARVPALIDQHLAGWLDDWLGRNGLSRDQVRSWVIHPGGPRILDAARSALGLASEATRVSLEVLSEYGNMSSATMVFLLRRLLDEGGPLPGVALGFGPGLTLEAVLLG